VPATSAFLVLLDWRQAYLFLGVVLLVVILPAGFFLIRNRPQDMGLKPLGEPGGAARAGSPSRVREWSGRDLTLREATCTPIFWRLTFGYFV